SGPAGGYGSRGVRRPGPHGHPPPRGADASAEARNVVCPFTSPSLRRTDGPRSVQEGRRAVHPSGLLQTQPRVAADPATVGGERSKLRGRPVGGSVRPGGPAGRAGRSGFGTR